MRQHLKNMLFVIFLVITFASRVGAQPTAADRTAAADAFDKGTSAWLSQDFTAAAHWFELAHRLAPNPAALLQAVRALDRSNSPLRAANLSLLLRDSYPEESQAQSVALDVLTRRGAAYALVQVNCSEPCTIDVNGVLTSHTSFFVLPSEQSTITAHFTNGDRSTPVSGNIGQTINLSFDSPPPPIVEPPVATPDEIEETRPRHQVIPLWAFLTTAGVTAASGATLIWSGVNTLNGQSEYENAIEDGDLERAQTLLEDGHNRERRTNILITTTASLAATTGIVSIFTRWHRHENENHEPQTTVGMSINRESGMVVVQGSF